MHTFLCVQLDLEYPGNPETGCRGNRELLESRPTLKAVAHPSDPGRHGDAQHYYHGIPSTIPPGGRPEETALTGPSGRGETGRGTGAKHSPQGGAKPLNIS